MHERNSETQGKVDRAKEIVGRVFADFEDSAGPLSSTFSGDLFRPRIDTGNFLEDQSPRGERIASLYPQISDEEYEQSRFESFGSTGAARRESLDFRLVRTVVDWSQERISQLREKLGKLNSR